jgi:lysophospholipase L1-like esterase
MLHDPSHIPQIPAEQEIVLSGSEKDILRRLGAEIATIGSLPVHQEKALFGINNIIAGDSPSEITEGIKEVVNSIRRKMPDTKILLLGPLPTGIKKDASSRLCYDVVQQNLVLVKFDKSVTFNNIGASFIAKDGSLDASLYLSDGMHLNANGYKVWANDMFPVISELLK